MIATLATSSVATTLLAYLRDRLGTGDLSFAEEPSPITDGWETYIDRFRLQSHGELPADYRAPLIVRRYESSTGLPRLRHEFAVQNHLGALGYPVAKPLLCEEDDAILGGPFMIMQEVPGKTLLDFMFHHPWRILDGPGWMAALHAWLHRLPPPGFPDAEPDLAGRHRAAMAEAITDYCLDGLRPGLDWLEQHAPASGAPESIIHLDFHPVNLIFQGGSAIGVLDWTESDVGDRHADIAATLVLIRTAPIDVSGIWQRFASVPGRWMLYRRYRRAYRRLMSLDPERLDYYIALAALRRLCRYGMWLRDGPTITGSKPSSIRYLNEDRVHILERCFFEPTRTRVQLRAGMLRSQLCF
jgi:aminoglycoside phosphotransferase (APT) family kinase protein